MKEGQTLWTRDELILAINLYVKTPFGKMHQSNPNVIELATLIGRTPSSVSFKLVNFASLDPSLKERGIKGAANASKLDREIWDEFYNNWDSALIASEYLLAKRKHTTIERLNEINEEDVFKEGIDKQRLVNTRINQCVFRKIILATYNNTCCITGINNPQLLIASHIIPWSKDKENRLNPMNGLALNALHDRAFEHGLIALDDDYKLLVSGKLKKERSEIITDNFLKFEGKRILMPSKFLPSKEFLKIHFQERYTSS